MTNSCAILQIDQVMRNGVLEPIEQDSAFITNPTGWENEGVASGTGSHGVKRKRVVPMLTYKRMTTAGYNPDDYASLDECEITVRDSISGKRARISKATVAGHGELGKSDSPEIKYLLTSQIQWL